MISILIFLFALSVDSFIAALTYRIAKIRIPIPSALIIAFIGSIFLGLSFAISGVLQNYIPSSYVTYLAFLIFLFMALSSLFQGSIKTYLKKAQSKKVKFAYNDFHFVLNIYVDETSADMDQSKCLSKREAFYLAIVLSLDSLWSGLAFKTTLTYPYLCILLVFFVGFVSLKAGSFCGERYRLKSGISADIVRGIAFLVLAIMRLI